MSEIYYDYADYWRHEGKLSHIDSLSFRLTKEHEAQEDSIRSAVLDHDPKSILEIGAGWGRIAKLIRDAGVEAKYLALDLSYDRLKQIKDKSIDKKVGDFMDFEGVKADLVLAVELLMHIPPDIIEDFVAKMKIYANDTIIILDYDPEQPRDIELADHNFLHDYDRLFPNAKSYQVNYVQKMRIWSK